MLAAMSVSAAPKIVSPEVKPDGAVTFRVRAPNAQQVFVNREGAPRFALAKNADGVWEGTTAPLAPDYYGYSLQIDGVNFLDPSNPLTKPNLLNLSNEVHVPGPATLSWEAGDVPHGEIHHHFYRSLQIGDRRDYYVYTPPGYDPSTLRRYPVLYLLHGYSDDASGWTAVGRANVILDNLIAWGRVRPMIIVMPLGYGNPAVVGPRAEQEWTNPISKARNYSLFRPYLMKEILPRVEAEYHTFNDRESRAIVGLSMGGTEALMVGLNELDSFAWIGAFSAGALGEPFDQALPHLTSADNGRIKKLWISCGVDDKSHIDPMRDLHRWLINKGIDHMDIETPGAHTWMVWRRNLTALTPLLFVDHARQSGPDARGTLLN